MSTQPEPMPLATATAEPVGESGLQEKKNSARVQDVEADEDMKNLDVIEQKMVLINRVINSQGMGRYQWCLFCLCGFGYLLDLAFAQLFGLIITPLQAELGVANDSLGDLSSSFNAGLCAGAFVWGVLIDVIGRKWAFNISLFVTSFFGLLLGVPSNFGAICALAALCGLGLGGNIPIDATILLEFLPARKRWLLVLLSVFQPLGVLLCSLIAWGLIPTNACNWNECIAADFPEGCCPKSSNMGWRYSCYTIGALTLGLFFIRFVVFNFRESPKFLLVKGRDQQAIDVLNSIAKFNKVEGKCLTITLEDLQHIDTVHSQTSSMNSDTPLIVAQPKKWYNLSHLKKLFSTRRAIFLTLLVWVIYICDYWSFSLAGSFLPIILQRKGAARAVSTNETYRNYIIQAVCGVPGVALGAALVEVRWLGQKWSMAITGALQGVTLFLFAVIDSQAGNVAFNTLEYFFQSAFNAILYSYAPQVFAASVRGTGVGIASTLGRLFSIVSPLIGAHILANTGLNDVLYVAGAPMFGVALLCLLLPNIGRGHVF